jgi:hypothetical protein
MRSLAFLLRAARLVVAGAAADAATSRVGHVEDVFGFELNGVRSRDGLIWFEMVWSSVFREYIALL